jgi:predicted nucleic acid-binding protein
MAAPAFVDTNILVYADDRADPAKQSRAQDLIRRLIREKRGRLSTQVLAEYFVAATRKLGIETVDARRRVELYSRFDVIALQPADILGAIDLHRLHGFSLWDALIVRAALLAGCRTLYTEDLQAGFRIETLEILNPFA